MKFSIFALVAAAASGVLAAPVAEVSALDKRANGYIKLCTEDNFEGDCGEIQSNNACFNVLKNDSHSSLYIKNAYCNIYEDRDCSGRKTFLYSGAGTSKRVPQLNQLLLVNGFNTVNWNDRISSVICWDY